MSKADKERIETINKIANNFGQTLLTLCDGDWDMALSVSTVLFASCCAQAALENDEDVEELFNECGVPAHEATVKFYAAFAAEELARQMAEGKTTEGDDET